MTCNEMKALGKVGVMYIKSFCMGYFTSYGHVFLSVSHLAIDI